MQSVRTMQSETLESPVLVPYSPGEGRWKRAYALVAEVLLRLSERSPVVIGELCGGSGRTPLGFGDLLQDRLVSDKIAYLDITGPGVLQLRDPKLLKGYWLDERLFCTLGGWSAPDMTSHLEPMRRLLVEGLTSERARASTVAALYPVLGQNNLCRRLGVTPAHIHRLRHLASLPERTQELIEQHPHSNSRLLEVDPNWSEEELLVWLGVSETQADELPAEDGDMDVREMMSTCVKLAAATASMVSDMSRKLDWLANELGYGDKR